MKLLPAYVKIEIFKAMDEKAPVDRRFLASLMVMNEKRGVDGGTVITSTPGVTMSFFAATAAIAARDAATWWGEEVARQERIALAIKDRGKKRLEHDDQEEV